MSVMNKKKEQKMPWGQGLIEIAKPPKEANVAFERNVENNKTLK